MVITGQVVPGTGGHEQVGIYRHEGLWVVIVSAYNTPRRLRQFSYIRITILGGNNRYAAGHSTWKNIASDITQGEIIYKNKIKYVWCQDEIFPEEYRLEGLSNFGKS